MTETTLLGLLYIGIPFVSICFLIARNIAEMKHKKDLRERIDKNEPISVVEFFKLRESHKGRLHEFDFIGVYVIYNVTKNMYYVGQATHVPNRVNAHFTGKGNGDVYADYKYGNIFTIQMVHLLTSGYQRLDDLERDLIQMHDSYRKGYNKTRGNK